MVGSFKGCFGPQNRRVGGYQRIGHGTSRWVLTSGSSILDGRVISRRVSLTPKKHFETGGWSYWYGEGYILLI